MRNLAKWTMIGALFAAAACGGGDDGDEGEELPTVDCSATIPAYADVAAFSNVCTDCHSSTLSGMDRNDAPLTINFDTAAAAKPYAEKAAEEVYEGKMPPATHTEQLTDAEKEELYLWALCGTPE